MKPPPMESRRVVGIPDLSTVCRRIAVAFVILHSAFAIAADAPTNPTRTELWVPTKQLDLILQKHPKAVLLNREQYETLIRDAAKTKPVVDPKLAPPNELIIEGLKLRGKVEPGATRVQLTGELTLNVPADSWSQKTIEWPYYLDISQVTSDGTILAWLSNDEFKAPNLPPETMRRLNLAARGPGRRVLRFTSTLPLYYRLRSGERGLDLQYTGCGGQIELELPPGAALLPGSAATHEGQRVTAAFDHRFIRRTDNGDPLTSVSPDKRTAGAALMDACRIRWIEAPGTLPQSALRFENSGSARFDITDSTLYTRLQFLVHVRQSPNGQYEAEWPVLGGPNTQVSEVSGPDVLTWKQDGQKLRVTLQQSSSLAPVTVQLSQSLVLDAASSVTLPSLSLPVLLTAQYTIGEGLDLLSLDTPHDNYIRLDREPPQLKLRPAKPRIEADVDVLARIDKDSVQIERRLALRSDRPATELKITLPAGEEFIAILSKPVGSNELMTTSNGAVMPNDANVRVVTPNNISQPIFSERATTSNVVNNATGSASPFRLTWRRVGQTISILPARPISPTNALEFSITSRLKLAKAWNGPRNPETVTIRQLDIPDAVKVAGYTALDFDDAWRVALKTATGLEDRDARLTPVKGRMAWFGLREHALSFEVERAEAVFSTEVIAYALPRARTIEIEGQFALDISGAPLRSFQVKLPIDAAKLLRVTSPLIGEQQLDEKTGIWTLTLRQESKGHQNIRFRLSLPASSSTTPATDAPTTDAPKSAPITATLPRIKLPQSRRFTGTWVIEANTDTQLSTQAQSMQPLDVLRAPAMADYQPRHRITSAFTYGATEHALTITARRHAHSELAALVVTQMQLRSVLDADGHSLHEAHLTLTHSGEQFIALTLPPAAELLSTLANRQAVKPVRSVGDAIAIPLPAGSANEPNTTVTIQYRLTTAPWNSRGELALTPLTLAPNIPILTTDWQVHAPPNFGYDKVKTTLNQQFLHAVPGVISQFAAMFAAGFDDPLNSAEWDGVRVDFDAGAGASQNRPGSVSGLANREISRRYAHIGDAKTSIARGDNLFREGDYEGALGAYKASVATIPNAPFTAEWLEYAALKYADCAVVVAKERAKNGNYAEARQLLNEAVASFPEHKNANSLLKQLDDPDRWPPANTPQNVENVGKVEKGLLLAHSSVEIGNYDTAIAQFQEVLRTDPYNSAARRGMETAERKRMENFKSASNDQQRAKMLAQVDEKMDGKVPTLGASPPSTTAAGEAKSRRLFESVDEMIFERFTSKSGLIPLDVTMPVTGRMLRFHGHQAPEPLVLQYRSWEHQMAWAVLAMLVGMLAFARFAWRRPWVMTLLVLVLAAWGFPLVFEGQALAYLNAATFGWLCALALRVLLSAMRYGTSLRQKVAPSTMQEVSA